MPDEAPRFAHYDRLHAEHVVRLAAHEARMRWLETAHQDQARHLASLDTLVAHQTLTHRALVEGFGRIEAALLAIKDLLERGSNGHECRCLR